MEESEIGIRLFCKDIRLKFHFNIRKPFWIVFFKTPMSEGYHPEVDDSPLCTENDSAKYRSISGCCIWIIVLGRFDIEMLLLL
jgi:hypothetical protein